MPDIVGIGAINLDFILDARKGRQESPISELRRLKRFEYGRENFASQDEVMEMVHLLSLYGTPSTSQGGSALNVISAIAATGAPMTVGYVGVCGQPPRGELDFRMQLDLLGVQSDYVAFVGHTCGLSVSFTHDGQRSMLTYPGANKLLDEHIDSNFDSLLDYLSGSRRVHLTSMADNSAPSALARLMGALKSRAPAVEISCDPGALWTGRARPREVDSILALSDTLLLNSREFDQLSPRVADSMTDLDAATRMLDRLSSGLQTYGSDDPRLSALRGTQTTVVVKSYDRVTVYARVGVEVTEQSYENRDVLLPSEIVDDTGAGDAFAAGLLAGHSLPGFSQQDAVDLGLRLARSKLGFVGITGISRFAAVFRSACADIVDRRRHVNEIAHGRRVFVGHGRDSQWRQLKDQLNEWGLEPAFFERGAIASRFVNDVLLEQVNDARFAVIVVTAEDETAHGGVRGRQNVIHEIGLMQGLLGFHRVAILWEGGVETFTNLDGILYLRFDRGRIDQAFHGLRSALEAAAVI